MAVIGEGVAVRRVASGSRGAEHHDAAMH